MLVTASEIQNVR